MKTTLRKYLLPLLVFLILLSLAGCASSKNAIRSVIFTQDFMTISGQSPDGWKASLESAGAGQFVRVQIQGDRVILEITESQRQFWLEKFKGRLADLETAFTSQDPDYRMVFSDDYRRIDYHYDGHMDPTDVIYYVLSTETYCICMQLFNGCIPDEWSVDMTIYNCDTGKVVVTGNDRDGISYTKEDWEASQ